MTVLVRAANMLGLPHEDDEDSEEDIVAVDNLGNASKSEIVLAEQPEARNDDGKQDLAMRDEIFVSTRPESTVSVTPSRAARAESTVSVTPSRAARAESTVSVTPSRAISSHTNDVTVVSGSNISFDATTEANLRDTYTVNKNKLKCLWKDGALREEQYQRKCAALKVDYWSKLDSLRNNATPTEIGFT